MPSYIVRQGDCISSIAKRHGLSWEKVWNHPNNTSLRSRRGNPNVLYPGDNIFVPEKEEKEESGSTEQRHRFRKKGLPIKLRLRIWEESTESSSGGTEREQPSQEDRPRSGVNYILEIDGNVTEGSSADDGLIQANIPPDARRGRLILEPGTLQEKIIQLRLGHLNPVSEVSGVKQRLLNLGFDCGDNTEESTPALGAALRAFQEKNGLTVTGDTDQATRDKLLELHGS